MEILVRNEVISLNAWMLVAVVLLALCYAILMYTRQLIENYDESEW